MTSGDGNGHIMGHRGLMLEIGDVLPLVRSEANIVVDRSLGHRLTMILVTLGLGGTQVMGLTRGRAGEERGEAGIHGLLGKCSVSQHLGDDAILLTLTTADIGAGPGIKSLVVTNCGHVASANDRVVSKRYWNYVMVHPIIAIVVIGCLEKDDVVIIYGVVVHEEWIDVIHVHGELAHGCRCCCRARTSNTVVDTVVNVVDVPTQLGLLGNLQVLLVDQGGSLCLRWHRQMLQSNNTEGMGSGANLSELLPGDVDLASVHELDDVRHGLSLQLQPKVLESEDDWGLDILFAKLVLEESATCSHDHLVDVDVMILADDFQVHEAGLCPQPSAAEAAHRGPGCGPGPGCTSPSGPRPRHV